MHFYLCFLLSYVPFPNVDGSFSPGRGMFYIFTSHASPSTSSSSSTLNVYSLTSVFAQSERVLMPSVIYRKQSACETTTISRSGCSRSQRRTQRALFCKDFSSDAQKPRFFVQSSSILSDFGTRRLKSRPAYSGSPL